MVVKPLNPLRLDEDAFRARMGSQVRALRRERGLTQQKLAELCGLSADTVRRLEFGAFSPSITTLRLVVGGLQLSLGVFLDSLESGERAVEREIVDLLGTRSADERLVALRVLRALLGPIEQRRE